MLENLKTFPTIFLILLLALAGIAAWIWVYVIQNQIISDIVLIWRKQGWNAVVEFLVTGQFPSR